MLLTTLTEEAYEGVIAMNAASRVATISPTTSGKGARYCVGARESPFVMGGGRGRGMRVGVSAYPRWLASNDASEKGAPACNSLRV